MSSFFLRNKIAFFVALGVLVLDQITKTIIKNMLPYGEKIEVIPSFFNIVYVLNRGIAFGILNKEGYHFYGLLFLTLLAICLIIFLLNTSLASNRLGKVSIGFILGGALGNLWDKIHLKGVVDFIDLYISSYHWPAFNIADSAITCGIFILFFNNFKKVR